VTLKIGKAPLVVVIVVVVEAAAAAAVVGLVYFNLAVT